MTGIIGAGTEKDVNEKLNNLDYGSKKEVSGYYQEITDAIFPYLFNRFYKKEFDQVKNKVRNIGGNYKYSSIKPFYDFSIEGETEADQKWIFDLYSKNEIKDMSKSTFEELISQSNIKNHVNVEIILSNQMFEGNQKIETIKKLYEEFPYLGYPFHFCNVSESKDYFYTL